MEWDNVIVWVALIMIYLYLYFLRRRKKSFSQTDSQPIDAYHPRISSGIAMNSVQPPPIPEEQLPIKDNEEKVPAIYEEGILQVEDVCRGLLWGEVLAKPKALQRGDSCYPRR